MPNKNEVQDNRDSRGHERLSSAASSPRSEPVKVPEPVNKRDLGKNYQYFTGNTLFCCGGRFQNSRDRPINIATGIFVILPGVLFFIYS
jgi:palmitoyltransferase ZDHHC9/14/18